jgi:hypothetical protein
MPVIFPIQNDLEETDALLQLLLNLVAVFVNRNIYWTEEDEEFKWKT